jgi:hypothetical protein
MGSADGGVLEKIKAPIGPLAARAGTKIWIMHALLSPDFFDRHRNISALK